MGLVTIIIVKYTCLIHNFASSCPQDPNYSEPRATCHSDTHKCTQTHKKSRAAWRTGSARDLHLVGTEFESQMEHQLF
jgi:hypothetical protein